MKRQEIACHIRLPRRLMSSTTRSIISDRRRQSDESSINMKRPLQRLFREFLVSPAARDGFRATNAAKWLTLAMCPFSYRPSEKCMESTISDVARRANALKRPHCICMRLMTGGLFLSHHFSKALHVEFRPLGENEDLCLHIRPCAYILERETLRTVEKCPEFFSVSTSPLITN